MSGERKGARTSTTDALIPFSGSRLKEEFVAGSSSSFSRPEERREAAVEDSHGRQLSRVKYLLVVTVYLCSFFLPPSCFFYSRRTCHRKVCNPRWHLSVPVRHSIRVDGSFVTKMAASYNQRKDAERVRPRPVFSCRRLPVTSNFPKLLKNQVPPNRRRRREFFAFPADHFRLNVHREAATGRANVYKRGNDYKRGNYVQRMLDAGVSVTAIAFVVAGARVGWSRWCKIGQQVFSHIDLLIPRRTRFCRRSSRLL